MNKKETELLKQAVYDIVRRIPPGRATSYGAIANAVGYPNWSRKIGRIMADCNSEETGIPAYRVVNSQGILSGALAFGTLDEIKKLLEAEGISIKNNRIVNWRFVFWNPIDEIHL